MRPVVAGPSRSWIAAPARVTVQRGAGLTPFFCVAAAYADVIGFVNLARELGRERPFHALQPPREAGRAGSLAAPTLDGLVGRYVEAIRGVQPTGPYLLGGYSSGGLIAHELAHRLIADGEDVRLLVLFDTPCRFPDWFYWLYHPLRRWMGPRLPRPRPGEPHRLHLWRSILTDDGLRVHLDALRGYRPRPYPAPVVLYAATGFHAERWIYPRVDGWRRVAAGRFERVFVSGDHHSFRRPPHVAGLARRLAARLAEAEGAGARPEGALEGASA
jgi:thioesterase domain-containing protein